MSIILYGLLLYQSIIAVYTLIVKPLINSNIIKFYKRCVDNALNLVKSSDINYVLDQFNCFHANGQFTVDQSPIIMYISWTYSNPSEWHHYSSQSYTHWPMFPASHLGPEKWHGIGMNKSSS